LGRHRVETSNEDKVFFPDDAITKGDLMDYYEAVAEPMLPWLRERPLMLQRFPDGIGAQGFYQKQAAEHLPDWVSTVAVRKAGDKRQELVVCDKKATLVYLANLGCVTFHPWLCRRDRLHHPDQLVVDLDPPAGGDFDAVRSAARACRALLDELGLPSFVKTTGSKGLHLVVPLDRRADFDSVRAFAREAMALLAARQPEVLTTEVRKDKRKGRVFLDVGRNAYAQTAVAPYSVRPLPGAPVATPIAWEELGRVEARSFTLRNLQRRLSRSDDPWKDLRRHASGLARARRRLEELRGDEGR
jgi:bifunctional non-homologous end joining protein LigD